MNTGLAIRRLPARAREPRRLPLRDDRARDDQRAADHLQHACMARAG